MESELNQISRKHLATGSNKAVDFECPICMDPVNSENASECLNCELILCRNHEECVNYVD